MTDAVTRNAIPTERRSIVYACRRFLAATEDDPTRQCALLSSYFTAHLLGAGGRMARAADNIGAMAPLKAELDEVFAALRAFHKPGGLNHASKLRSAVERLRDAAREGEPE